ncbi:40-kDa huntingtin-associated protein [Nilaparvata lugens]|uniref:40-kDa huntingtin-associated protein n=1 Tax=Nilaparvata lugens TaxID=108931 RepID=UPI000B98A858|nr:40-kDa huntingtin-associated protein [Nilaparvata lugens]XP_039288992.1 40-kDa huntingtin-associated protein [Nilaparvata lugens]
MADIVMDDFLVRYKNISNKLKKRFLRKPNVSEPSDQFGALGMECERGGVVQYAGLCQLAVARCEKELGNSSNAAWALRTAGRHFLIADSPPFIEPVSDRFEGALGSFSEASRLWQSDVEVPLSAGLSLETGAALDHDPHQAVTHYAKAASLLSSCPPQQLPALCQLLSCRIKAGDYEGALNTANDLAAAVDSSTSVPFGLYSDILLRCEITRVLLVLLLRPPPSCLSPVLSTLLEKYTWQNQPPVKWLDEQLFLLLQSLVLACQAQDHEALCETEGQLWNLLDNEQQHLLSCLIRTITTSG